MIRAGIRVVAESTRSWLEIDETRLLGNYRVVREAAGANADVLAVIKANAYGHGLEECAVALVRADGLASERPFWLGVADAAEGVRVRRALQMAGLSHNATEILTLYGVVHDDVRAIAEHGLTPVVWTQQQVELLRGSGARVHVEMETGMSRQGVRPGASLDALLRSIELAGLKLDGVMTHFHSAEIAGSERTREQKARFEAAVAQVRAAGLKPRWIHAGSSSSVDVGEDPAWLAKLAESVGACAMVRSGIALYGYCLPAEGVASCIRARLQPVMTWKTRVLDVREMAAGETIGYDATFTAKRAMCVALLPVGYADGLRRELSGTNDRPGGWVMARASDGAMRQANIVGRVSMDLTTVDVTDVDWVRVGDEVVLLGDGITADDHARIAGTIAYEILCGIRA